MHRRKFLKSATAIALVATTPAYGFLMRGGLVSPSGFNGGKSQGQSSLVAGSVIGDFPFINILKAQAGFQGSINPSILDANGYPTNAAISGGANFVINTDLPNQASKPATLSNPFVVTWEGNSSINIGNSTSNFVSGSKDAVFDTPSQKWLGRYEWYPVYAANGSFSFQMDITRVDASSYINNLALFYSSDEQDFLAGEMFAPEFRNAIKQANFGVFRDLDWIAANTGNISTWDTRKSIGNLWWLGDEFRASLYAGTATPTSSAIVKATLSSLVWSGASFTGSITNGALSVSSVASGALAIGQAIAGPGLSQFAIITGGSGTSWTVSPAISSSGSYTSGLATATAASAHGITSGNHFPIQIFGAAPSAYNQAYSNGSIQDTIATATGVNTFTYPLAANPGTATAPGTYSANCLDYNLTVAGSYVWTNSVQGDYTPGGAPPDKQTMHLAFGADCMLVQNIGTDAGGTLTITFGGPTTFNWPLCPLSNGNRVGVTTGYLGGNLIQGFSPNATYFVVNKSGDSFQVSLTSGGTPISSTDTSGRTNTFITRLPTLNQNATGAVPIKGPGSQIFVATTGLPMSGGTNPIYSTNTFDAGLQSWLLMGGSTSAGLQNGIPVEVFLQLCFERGMHPMISIPGFALDPMTDFVPSLGSYIKTTYQQGSAPWMIPRFEPGNEVWNTALGINITPYCAAKAYANWQIYGSDGSGTNEEYGKWCSTIGQALASVFGLGNLGITYDVVCGSQYVQSFPGPTSRLLAPAYVNQSAPAQSGYLKAAAADGTTNYVSAVITANYTNPTMQGAIGELQNTWGYFYTNVGNTAAQNANLNAYVDTLPCGTNPTPPWYAGTKAFGAQFGVNKMYAYEGGFSPDLVGNVNGATNQWNSPITGASKASSCVLTLASFSSRDGAGGGSGNPAEIGMVLCLQGVGGMTQLNCLSTTVTITGGTASIPWSGNILIANQGIMFQSGASLPANILPLTPYYVSATGLSSSAFQLSATPGGSPIIPAGTGTFSAALDSGWVVTGVSGNSVTILCNSTAFGTYTAATGTAYYLGSVALVNNFRIACSLYAPDMFQKTLDNYKAWTDAGGTFPSQYQVSGTGIWAPVIPDIFGVYGQEWQAIVAYNH